jgi:PPM family protein phosphatase
MPLVDFCELTVAGSGHAVNEDTIGHWPLDDGLVFAVADGIGEQAAGEVASHLALDTVGRELSSQHSEWPVLNRLRHAVQAANVELYQKAVTVPELRGMATTITATALVGRSLVTAHVGDCRLWLLRNRQFTQLTKDHTWVWAHLPGAPTVEQRHGQPRRYSLPRCLGHELVVSIDLLSMELSPGDVLLQSSDGMHGALSEQEIQRVLTGAAPEEACQTLVGRAREENGRDDVSVQVARVRTIAAAAAQPWWRLGR